jgi:cardiolipin synthase
MRGFRSKFCFFVSLFLLAVLIAAFIFVFNPLGLGPEPEAVLSEEFFIKPAEDLGALELLIDGEEAVDRINEEIVQAKSSIFIQVYIWKDDNLGRRLTENLKSLARNGVKVTVRKDMLGTFFELGDMLRGRPSPVFTGDGIRGHENIDVQTEMSADTDHSKYVIVDGRVVAFGGMNVADEYHIEWHDYMALFIDRRWTEAFEQKVLRSKPWPQQIPFVIAVNDRNASEIRTAFVQMIDNARERVVIEHAYFSDDKIIEALERAAERGLTVDVILPGKPDTHQYANMVTINRLLEHRNKGNINIYLYPQMSHAKVALSDGVIASVGSANLTPRSMLRSREITLFVHGMPDSLFVKRLREQLEKDIAVSEEVGELFNLGFIDRVMAFAGKYTW